MAKGYEIEGPPKGCFKYLPLILFFSLHKILDIFSLLSKTVLTIFHKYSINQAGAELSQAQFSFYEAR